MWQKKKLDVFQPTNKQFTVIENDTVAIGRFIDSITKSKERTLVIMEATGGYESLLAEMLLRAGIDCVIANPKQVRDFTRGMGQLAKTDEIDAKALAQFGEIVKPELAEKPDENEQNLKSLVHRRDQVNGQLTQEKNRLQQTRNDNVKQSIEEAIEFYKRQKKELEKQIQQITKNCQALQEKAELIESVKGVGPVTTAVLLCELPELGELNRAEVAKLAGVAPIARDSGTKNGQRRIYGGRRMVRRAIYMATLVAMRWNDKIKSFYQHLSAKGKPAKVAMVACMRKMLTILNSMVKNNQKWGENKLAIDKH